MRRPLTALLLVTTVVAAACTDESSDGGTTAPGTEPTTTVIAPDLAMVAGQPIPEARCQANQEAGTIVYLSSFDFAATASIVDVLVAKSKGYYEALCLDVELKPSFSVDNYPQIAANDAQFSSGGSFSEMVDFAGANDAGFVALAVEGRTGIDALITKDGAVPTLADIAGTKIGVKGAITPSVKAMLAQQGLIEGEDYETVLLDGFDPLVHIEVPDIVGFPGYKSNEPLQLEAAGVPFTLYDPSDYGVPGSFGVVYTNDTFLTEHPTAAQDFMRATMRGLADAIADPAGAAEIAVGFIEAGDNIMFLSAESETARWGVESQLVADGVAPGAPRGLPLVDELTAEVTTYASIGLFDGVAPDITTMVDPAVLAGVYDADGTVIWPSGG